jgi:WD40-like Beta Propeller Repeat
LIAVSRALRALSVGLVLTLAAAAPAGAEVYGFDGELAGEPARSAAGAFEHGLPSATVAGETDRIEAQLVNPFLVSVGDHLSAISALGSPKIAKDPAAGFTLDTERGPLRLRPTWVEPGERDGATVERAAAVFPSVAGAIDALVRPTAVGVATYLHVSGPLASRTLDWRAELASGLKLRELNDGGIAVVVKDGPGSNGNSRRERREAIAAGDVADPRAQYDAARRRHAGAGDGVIAIIHPPQAQDAAGNPIAARLDAHGDTLALTLGHREAAGLYPALASLVVSYPDAWERTWERVPGIGPAQPGPDGLTKALLPSGRVFMTHGPDSIGPGGEELEEDPDDDYEQEGDSGRRGGAGGGGGSSSNGSLASVPHVCAEPGSPRLTLVWAGPDPDDFTADVKRRIRRVFASMNSKLYGEGIAAGGQAHGVRYRVGCDSEGRATVIPAETHSAEVVNVITDAIAEGADDPTSKYLIFGEFEEPTDPDICGIGDTKEDDVAGKRNASNGPSVLNPSDTVDGGWALLYGRGCWHTDVAMHESAHTMGAVQASAPGSNGFYEDEGEEIPFLHCADGYDVMCYQEYSPVDETPAPFSPDECTLGARGLRFDCNYDSYFDTATEFGEYLSEHWNLGSRHNLFLESGSADLPPEEFVYWGDDVDQKVGIYRRAETRIADDQIIFNWVTCDDCASAESPALSPNGRQVAFTSRRYFFNCVDLYTMRIDGSNPRRIWDCMDQQTSSIFNPQYAAANGRLIFEHTPFGEEDSDIFSMRTDGSGLTRVVDWPGPQGNATMTGSGRQMAFTSSTKPDGTPIGDFQNALFITRRDGSDPVQITDPAVNFIRAEYPRFSYDGNWIAFEGMLPGEDFPHAYVVRINGTGLQRISAGVGGITPEWSPSNKVVYAQYSDDFSSSRLVRVDISSDTRTTLPTNQAYASDVAYRQASYFVDERDDYEPPTPEPLPAYP